MKNFGRKLIILAILATMTAGGGWYWYTTVKKDGTPSYVTEKVARQDFVKTVSTTGTLQAVNTVDVGTQVSGTISKVFVDYNSAVKKGEILALIDPAILQDEVMRNQADLHSAQANMETARANLNASRAELENARRISEREERLYLSNYVSRSTADDAKTAYLTASATVAAREAAVKNAAGSVQNASASLRKANTNLGYTRIVSPINGTVVGKSISQGQTVAASLQTPTLFTLAEDLTHMQVEADVDEADIGMVKSGMEVSFTVDAYPDDQFRGIVQQVRLKPTTKENVVTYTVIIYVSNKDMKLMPGMTANVKIEVAKASDVLVVSSGALRFKPSEEGSEGSISSSGFNKGDGAGFKGGTGGTQTKGTALWVVEPGKTKKDKPTLRFVRVELIMSDGSKTAVSGDLREDEEVATGMASPNGQKGGGSAPAPRMF